MTIIKKLALAAVAVCGLTMATPAQAYYHHGGHYYGGRHYWHGRWWGPGYYGPSVFVGAPFYWGGYGPRVVVGYGGPYHRHGYYYHRRYYGHRWHRW